MSEARSCLFEAHGFVSVHRQVHKDLECAHTNFFVSSLVPFS